LNYPNQKSICDFNYRPDIDGLRTIAIILVIGFHFFPEFIHSGFIGVDIFFVISGYLITAIIYPQIQDGKFNLKHFYLKRIRRILPITLTCLIVCYIIGWFYLLDYEYSQLSKYIAGGAFSLVNFIAFFETGYFDNSSITKPLIHLWSLGIEEQFYLFWPILLSLFIYSHKESKFFTLLLIFCLLGIVHINDPNALFYLPHSRFWELLMGATLASINSSKILSNRPFKISHNLLSLLGVLLLSAGIFFINEKSTFPGFWALLPVLGTMLIISSDSSFFNEKILSSPPVVFIGKISFSLYIWHWPGISFPVIFRGEMPDLLTRSQLLIGVIFVSICTFYLIEQPIRKTKSKITIITLVSLTIIIGLIGLNTYKRDGLSFRQKHFYEKISNSSSNEALIKQHTCFLLKDDPVQNFKSYCTSSKNKVAVLWGDSHAAYLAPGLSNALERHGYGLNQYTSADCKPKRVNLETEREDCLKINLKVMELIDIHKPEIVFLHGNWEKNHLDSLLDIYELLKQKGIKVFIIGPAPKWSEAPSKILFKYWRQFNNLPDAYSEKIEPRTFNIDSIFRGQFSEQSYISLTDIACQKDLCLNRIPKDQKYFLTTIDGSHITPEMSFWVSNQFDWDKILITKN
jgi:peptidoglycan/LPS O-acetylase OafA/YrhL